MRTVLDQIWAIKFCLFLFHAFVYWGTVVLMELFCPLRDMIFFSQYFVVYFFLLLGIYAFRGFNSILTRDFHDTVVSVTAGALFGCLAVIPFLILFYSPRITKWQMMLLTAGTILSVSFYRLLVSRFFSRVTPVKTVFIIGSREKWEPVLLEIKEKLRGRIAVKAFLNPSPEAPRGIIPSPPCSVIIGDPELFREDAVKTWVKETEAAGCRREYLPQIAEDLLHRIPLAAADAYRNYYRMAFEMVRPEPAQRVLDILVAVPGLLLGLLFSLFIVPAILLDSGFPVLFRQRRIGLDGKLFTMHKFRTMSTRKKKEAAFADEDEERITRTGNFLRKFRLDEIPQLWDVLRGVMSIVGPRPEQPEFVDQFNQEIPFYTYRHKLRPGITGWAQINFKYTSNTDDTRQKLEYDLFYIKNRTTLLDLQIILKTAETMLGMRGAK